MAQQQQHQGQDEEDVGLPAAKPYVVEAGPLEASSGQPLSHQQQEKGYRRLEETLCSRGRAFITWIAFV